MRSSRQSSANTEMQSAAKLSCIRSVVANVLILTFTFTQGLSPRLLIVFRHKSVIIQYRIWNCIMRTWSSSAYKQLLSEFTVKLHEDDCPLPSTRCGRRGWHRAAWPSSCLDGVCTKINPIQWCLQGRRQPEPSGGTEGAHVWSGGAGETKPGGAPAAEGFLALRPDCLSWNLNIFYYTVLATVCWAVYAYVTAAHFHNTP